VGGGKASLDESMQDQELANQRKAG
jgi:hypothetical protein